MATDRALIKGMQAGVHRTIAAIVDPTGETNKLHEHTFQFELDADASLVERGIRVPKACIVKSVTFTPTTLLAANGSSYITLDVQKRDGAGGSAVSVATTNTNSAGANVSLAAFVPATLTITSTAANKTFAAGNVLTFKSTETGTPATPLGCCEVTVEWI